MADIFISYSRPDRGRIAKLAAALEKAGFSIWWDFHIAGGTEFSKETAAELKAAKAVLVVWSKHSIESMWVADEASVGRTKKNLVPISIDKIEPPLGFGQIQSIDFTDWDSEAGEPCFLELNKVLAAMLQREPAAIALARRSPLRALRRIVTRRPLLAAIPLVAICAAVVAIGLDRLIGSEGSEARAIDAEAVAVLPFVNAGGDAREDYLSEGFSEELRDQIGRIPGMKVAARTSSVAFEGSALEAPAVAERLGVGRLVEGSVKKERGRFHVDVRIIDGRTGFQTWSQSFDRAATDLVRIEEEVANALAVSLTGRADAAVAPPATLDLSAYDKMLVARHYEQEVRDAQTVDEEKLGKAIDLYREAASADPDSALLHARLGGALLYAGDADAAAPEIERAVELDPDLSEVQYTLGLLLYARGETEAESAFARAVELNPNNADALSAYALSFNFKQDLARAAELHRRALALDPMGLERYVHLATVYGSLARRKEALELVAEIKSRFSTAAASSLVARIHDMLGDFDLAIVAATENLQRFPDDSDLKAQLAELYARIGDFESADRYEPEPGLGQLHWRRRYRDVIDLGEELVIEQPEEAWIWWLLGFAYNAVGEHDQAIRVLTISGLPEVAYSPARRSNAPMGLVFLMDALAASGETARARDIADWILPFSERMISDGNIAAIPNLFKACALSTLQRDEEAMNAFAAIDDAPAMPWMPFLHDLQCFERFKPDGRYRQTIANLENRQAGLRRKTAAALERAAIAGN